VKVGDNMEKMFKTLDEQIEILKGKGLIVEDEKEAEEVLLRENYFFINGYRHLLMNSASDKTFVTGSTFRELYSLFLFDRYVRNILFKHLLIIENNLKSVVSYQLSKKYGFREKDYLNVKNFTTDHSKQKKVKDLVDKMRRQIRVNCANHNATMHYISNYGYIPLWILVKVLSFGIVCELYTILKQEDKITIASVFKTSTRDMDDFLPILANYRNLCAHEDIVFEHRTERYILDNKYHDMLNIPMMDGEYIYGKNDVFALVIIMKHLLKEDQFHGMMREIEYEIEKLDGRIDSVPIEKILDRMGFPTNYMELMDI